MSIREESQGQAQDAKRLHLPIGLEAPRDAPGGEEDLDFPAETAAPRGDNNTDETKFSIHFWTNLFHAFLITTLRL